MFDFVFVLCCKGNNKILYRQIFCKENTKKILFLTFINNIMIVLLQNIHYYKIIDE